jgi:hypothetical protein
VQLVIQARNAGSTGEMTFLLQKKVEGDYWAEASSRTVEMSSGKNIQISLQIIADGLGGDTLEYRLLLLDSGVEKERISISPLLVKDEVERDGEALAGQVTDSALAVVMYLIALVAMSYAVWTMIQIRRIRRGDEEIEGDQTAEVIEDMMDGKTIPTVPGTPTLPTAVQHGAPTNQPAPPLPPTGLPEGWTEQQWQHYGHQYVASMGSND